MLRYRQPGLPPPHPPSLYLGQVLREFLCLVDLGLLLLLGGQCRRVERQDFLFLCFKFPTNFSKLKDLLTLLGVMKKWLRENKRGPCSSPGNASMLACAKHYPSISYSYHKQLIIALNWA